MSGEIETESLRKCIELSTVTDTSAVKVIATAKNPEIAASICNNLTSIAPEYVAKAVGVGSINTIDKAKVYETPVAPNVIKNTLLGMAAALLIVVTIILITDYFDNTVKDVALLEKKLLLVKYKNLQRREMISLQKIITASLRIRIFLFILLKDISLSEQM